MLTPLRWLYVMFALVPLLAAGRASALTATQQGNLLRINGQPATLTFARGCTNPADIPAYHALGFNTMLVTIDSPGPRILKQADTLIDAAEHEGLYVLIELANGYWSDNQYADLNDKDYLENCRYFLDAVIPRFQARPTLVGWVISTPDEERCVSNVGSLVEYLKQKYGTIDNLTAAWSQRNKDDGRVQATIKIPSFEVMSVLSPAQIVGLSPNSTVRDKVLEDLNAYQHLIEARNADFRGYLLTRYSSLTDLLASWQCAGDWYFSSWKEVTVESVLKQEKAQPGSSTPSLLELARYQATVPRMVMDWWARQVAQRDDAHLRFAGSQHAYRTLITLPHSVNGALTECYPGLAEADTDTQNPHAVDIARRGNQFIVLAGALAPGIEPMNLANALYAAATHGASGLCITDWDTLRNQSGYAAVVQAALADIQQRHVLGRVPAPGVAIVYSPYAPGPRRERHGVYGYMNGFLYPGPAMFFFSLREGTSYGQLDFLAADDLSQLPLVRYQTLLLPSVLDLPDAAQHALLQFAQAGGVVVADLGAGTVQANQDFNYLPPTLMQLFNVNSTPGVQTVHLNLEAYQPHACFPSLTPGLRTNGLANGYMITQMARAVPLGGTQLLFSTVASTSYQAPVLHPRVPLPPKPVRGVFIYQQGYGYAIYAPFPLYRFWMPGNMLFGQFHADLFGHNPAVALQIPIGFIPTLAEVAKFADGGVVAWTRDQTRPVVAVANPSRQLFDTPQGYCEITPDMTSLHYDVGGYHLADPLPIWLGATTFTVDCAVQRDTGTSLEFSLGTDAVNRDAPVSLVIRDGRYAVKPNSQHRLIVVTSQGTQRMTVQADANGNLALTLPAARCAVRLVAPDAADINDGGLTLDLTPEPDAGTEMNIDLAPEGE